MEVRVQCAIYNGMLSLSLSLSLSPFLLPSLSLVQGRLLVHIPGWHLGIRSKKEPECGRLKRKNDGEIWMHPNPVSLIWVWSKIPIALNEAMKSEQNEENFFEDVSETTPKTRLKKKWQNSKYQPSNKTRIAWVSFSLSHCRYYSMA